MQQAKAAVAALSDAEQAQVSVVGITLDPANDTPERLRLMAQGQGVSAPRFRFGTGAPAVVEKLLDDLDVSRKRDPMTGVIDHANLFFVVDRRGRIAYRLTIGGRQLQWLTAALRCLVGENAGAALGSNQPGCTSAQRRPEGPKAALLPEVGPNPASIRGHEASRMLEPLGDSRGWGPGNL